MQMADTRMAVPGSQRWQWEPRKEGFLEEVLFSEVPGFQVAGSCPDQGMVGRGWHHHSVAIAAACRTSLQDAEDLRKLGTG